MTHSLPTLALLAGGHGTRMGLPKSHLRLGHLPILQYLHTQHDWPGPTLLITAPTLEHPPAHHLFTNEIPDPIPQQGPLRGLHTALTATTTDIVILTTVDMPNLTRIHFEFLANQLVNHPTTTGIMLQRAGHPVGLASASGIVPSKNASLIEPFPCALRRALLPELTRRLDANDRSLQSLARSSWVTLLPAPADWPDSTWLNLNYPEDLAQFESTV